MKTQSTNFFTELAKTYRMRFIDEPTEMPATEPAGKDGKIFCAAEVWNIQRNKRARVQRRFSF